MTVFAVLYDNVTSKAYDISNVIFDIEITTKLFDDPGKATFKLVKAGDFKFNEGATVAIQVDGVKMFLGYVFVRKWNTDNTIVEVTCYDQLRYLKAKDSLVFEGMTSDQIFSQVCSRLMLNYKVRDKSSYVCARRNNANTSYYDMIKRALDETIINSGKYYIIRDNYGTLEHVNVFSLQPGVMLGDKSGLLSYNYEISIDKETYNQIKLYKEDTKNNTREVYLVNDTINGGKTIKQWGILQLYKKVDNNMNMAQMQTLAKNMLAYYNSARKSLKLECLGVPAMCAGSIFRCKISNLGDTSIDSYLLVNSCQHKITNNTHTMTLETEVVK